MSNERVIKTSLESVVKEEKKEIIESILTEVNLHNRVVVHSYQLLKMVILKMEEDNSYENFDHDSIMYLMKLIAPSQRAGTKRNSLKDKIDYVFHNYYKETMKEKLTSSRSGNLFNYSATEILNSLENNIKLHYVSHLKRIVKAHFYIDKDLWKSLTKDEKKEYNKKINLLINDILNGETKSEEELMLEWKEKFAGELFPEDFQKSIPYDVECNPQKYLRYMLKISKLFEIENNNCKNKNIKIRKIWKQFKAIPLRKSLIPRCITIDTRTLIHFLFDYMDFEQEYSKVESRIEQNKVQAWNSLFDMTKINKIGGRKIFDYFIRTDGVSVSLIYLKDEIAANEKAHIKEKKKQGKNQKKNSSNIEDKNLKDKANKKKKQTKEDEENEEEGEEEDGYLENLSEEELLKYMDYTLLGVDPGRNSIITLSNGESEMRYTKMQRRKECFKYPSYKIRRFFNLSEDFKKFQTDLSEFNSKTCFFSNFLEFVKFKNGISQAYLFIFQNTKLRKWRWRIYINTQRSEANLINRIKEKYGRIDGKENPILIGLGNWSQTKTPKFNTPTPNKGIKKLLAKNFPLVMVDEYRTSLICSVCQEDETEKFFYREHPNPKKLDPNGNRKQQRVHSLLTCKKCSQDEQFVKTVSEKIKDKRWCDSNSSSYTKFTNQRVLNRDVSASRNIHFLMNCWIYDQSRPPIFQRSNNNIV